jgi:hypothetical protein
MARNPFVKPDTVRLELTGGDWLEVKKRLTAGEYRERLAREYTADAISGRMALDMRQAGFALIVSYAVGWSFIDAEKAPVPFSEDALKAVDIDTFREILQAVEAHDAADEAARSAEKNERAGATVS